MWQYLIKNMRLKQQSYIEIFRYVNEGVAHKVRLNASFTLDLKNYTRDD